MMTDWGARIISNRSSLYDPLSYHYGSVWPLFTGWAAMGAYRYGRPHVGYQALMANVGLTYAGALGYVTELLSGDFNAPFGRSSHHQVWSEAMVVTPTLRGLLGIEASAGGNALSFAPQIPADWQRVSVRNFATGRARFDFTIERERGRERVLIARRGTDNRNGARAVTSANNSSACVPAGCADSLSHGQWPPAKIPDRAAGDVARCEVIVEAIGAATEIVYAYDEGTEVYLQPEPLLAGQSNQGLRVLRSRADKNALRLTLEGLGGRSYTLRVRTPQRIGEASGVKVSEASGRDPLLTITFDGAGDTYVRREIIIPLLR